MTKKTRWVMTLALVGALTPYVAHAQSAQDEAEAAVSQAAMDYLEGFYEGDADKIRRGVHPDVVKYGFMGDWDTGEYRGTAMSFADMIEFVDGVKERGDYPADDAPKDFILLEVLDQTAAVKVVAWWGID